MVLKLSTIEQFEAFRKEAKDWLDNSSGNLWFDCKGVAWTAIAEFNANKQGLTIYTHRDGDVI